MPKLSDLLAEKAAADIQIGGSTLKIVFYVMVRERFSQEQWDALLAIKGRDYLKELLPRIVASWDLVDDEGQRVPVTAEAIEQHSIPDRLLLAIEQRIFGSDLSGKAISSSLPGT